MFKKLAIAVACSIAMYGLAKLIHRHVQLVTDRPDKGPTDELPEAREATAHQNGQSIEDVVDPITTGHHFDQAASVQGSEASGEDNAIQAREPAREASCL